MATFLIGLHILTHELPVLCLAIYYGFKFLGKKATEAGRRDAAIEDGHVCCDHTKEN